MTSQNDAQPKIFIAARNSGQQGAKARRQVANECHRTAQDLYTHTGIDIRDVIPSVPEIIEALQSRAIRKTSLDSKSGKKFVNEFLALHLDRNVVLLVSTGSGHKIDADLNQPYLTWLNYQLQTLRPDILAWHRLDRVFRTALLGATTLHLCVEIGIQMVDGEKGIIEGDSAIFALMRAKDSSDEASRMPAKTRSGQIDGTGTDMSSGAVQYAVAHAPPAGMMVVRMKAPNGQLGGGRLCFDSPTSHPDPADVAYGLPEVFHQGSRVDQVANVRFALSRLGQAEWTMTQVAEELIERGFSTQRLRMENTVRSAFTHELVKGEFHRVLRPIVNRLDFYQTGVLPVRFNVAGVNDIEIVNCFPPDGRPWASEKDFNRIRTFLQSTKGGGPATQGLTGVVVQTEGGPLPLRSAPDSRRTLGTPSYVVRPSEAGRRASIHLPALPHAVLAESLVEALAAHADQLLRPLLQRDLPEAEPLRNELRRATKRVDDIEGSCQAILQSMSAEGDDGQRLITGAALSALSKQYNELAEAKLEPAKADVERLMRELHDSMERSLRRDPAIQSDLLLRMVASLRDPYDTSYNSYWKGAVRIERVSREAVRIHDTAGTITRWEGTIRTSGAGHEFGARFSGEYMDGAATQLRAKAARTLELMLRGVPFENIEQSNARGVRLALAEQLGFDSRYFGLPTCTDPRLVRIGAHLAADPLRRTDRVAQQLDEPLSLVEAVLSQLTSGRPVWQLVSGRPT